jgi:hypothetical protein
MKAVSNTTPLRYLIASNKTFAPARTRDIGAAMSLAASASGMWIDP